VLQDSLPTGEKRPVDAARDLNRPRRFTDLEVDDVLTDLAFTTDPIARSQPRATLWGAPRRSLRLFASEAFREMVIFTPPHRQAFCVEPYTCVTDAVNLQARGVDAGWQVLQPGDRWRGAVWLGI
jgi:aldose 1-epimerase